MPELPEVETTRRGIMKHVLNQPIVKVNVHQPSLRWRVETTKLRKALETRVFLSVSRRGKYLLFNNAVGTMLVHLGMSGSLRIVTNSEARRKHDHLEWLLANGSVLRFHDPRRFGCVLWTTEDINEHRLLRDLGPEPLSKQFHGEYLYQRSRSRKQAVKTFLMNSNIVTGVGNIYASEALFLAGTHPNRAAGRISQQRYELLAQAIKLTMNKSIKLGGTTLRDFVNSDGEPGYFRQQLNVYEKQGMACIRCKSKIKRIIQAQRASYYCPKCQT